MSPQSVSDSRASSRLCAEKAGLADIARLRQLYLQEMNTQIRYNAQHERGWSDSYLLLLDGVAIGYGSVHGKEELTDRDTVFEFYLVPPHRAALAREAFETLLAASRATYIEAQSNDRFLTSLLRTYATDIQSPVVLLADYIVTTHAVPGVSFRKRRDDDKPFEHTVEPIGDYVLVESDSGEIVASGGFLKHYNVPFADLYMEVRPDRRERGFGSFLLQEVKVACYLAGRVPAARTSVDNTASRATLIKAGLRVSGFISIGRVREMPAGS